MCDSKMPAKTPNLESVYVSKHAVTQLRKHYQNIGVRGTLNLLSKATIVSGELVAAITFRALEACQDTYAIDEERRGIFVLAEPKDEGMWSDFVLVTYLRLGAEQQGVAQRFFEESA
jgi:hypothetical protein